MERFRLTLDEGENLPEGLLEGGATLGHDCSGTLARASCRVVVLEGMEHLSSASEDELDMLDRSGASAPHARLACQTIGAGGFGT